MFATGLPVAIRDMPPKFKSPGYRSNLQVAQEKALRSPRPRKNSHQGTPWNGRVNIGRSRHPSVFSEVVAGCSLLCGKEIKPTFNCCSGGISVV
ncbi:hypothetical protein [Rhizobium sp. GCM10022189]|uniref:hypothetical protein n=1 Tax=Rhizobium sp. GCM10022189 TaxID=3252654 RepID=UPI0036210EC6